MAISLPSASSNKRTATTVGIAGSIIALPVPEAWQPAKVAALVLLGIGELFSSRWLEAQLAKADAAKAAAELTAKAAPQP